MENEMDTPHNCSNCDEVFDADIHFALRPLRLVCPFCGHTEGHYDEDAREGK